MAQGSQGDRTTGPTPGCERSTAGPGEGPEVRFLWSFSSARVCQAAWGGITRSPSLLDRGGLGKALADRRAGRPRCQPESGRRVAGKVADRPKVPTTEATAPLAPSGGQGGAEHTDECPVRREGATRRVREPQPLTTAPGGARAARQVAALCPRPTAVGRHPPGGRPRSPWSLRPVPGMEASRGRMYGRSAMALNPAQVA